MEREELCIIPRNLNGPDIVFNSKLVELNWKQVGFIGLGFIGGIMCFKSGLPYVPKLIISSISATAGLTFGLFKYKDNTLDELIVDNFVYSQRKSAFQKLEKGGGIIVNIKTKREESEVGFTKETFMV